jgi:glucuronate isomerase
LQGETLTDAELGAYQRVLLEALGRAYARLGWTMCLHIGAQRNNNSRQLRVLGPDTGYDSVSDRGHSDGLAALLDALDTTDELPKTMLFNLNPAMNEVLSTLIGCFQDGNTFGKLQFGPAWWFNDHKEGNLRQLAGLAQHGVLGTSVGMVTDSRSFASYPRHDYFRRLLCRLLGEWVEAGEAPHDFEALAQIVRGVSYDNAKNYFGL